MLLLNNFRSFFPIFQKHPELVYFDTASTALKPLTMIQALETFYKENGLSLRNFGPLSIINDKALTKVRQQTAIFLNTKSSEIIFTKGTTDSLNMIAHSLESIILPGDEIITSLLEHNSSLLPWMNIAQKKQANLVFIALDEKYQITVSNFKKVLSPKTKVVVLTHMSNILGYETPIKEITALAHQQNALVILDAAQSIAHLPLDLKDLDVDFMAFSAHKIYGPFGLGILFGKEYLLKQLNPPTLGGGGVKDVSQNHFTFHDLPYYKWQAGTPNIAGIMAWQKALEFVLAISYQLLQQHEKKIKSEIIKGLKNIPQITILNLDSSHMIAFNFQNIHAHDVESFLANDHIYVRTGQHCANLALKSLQQNSIVRISVGIHNNQQDIDTLINSLERLSKIWHSY